MNEYNFSIALIVKDEEHNVQRLAATVKDFIEDGGKVYFYDTGSTDNTVEVAKFLGFTQITSEEDPYVSLSEVYHHAGTLQPLLPDRNEKIFHFAKARNILNRQIPTEWVMVVDADDMLEKFDFRTLQNFIVGNPNVDYIKYWYKYSDTFHFYRSHVFFKVQKFDWYGVCHEYIKPNVPESEINMINVSEQVLSVMHLSGLKETRQKYTIQLIYQYLQAPGVMRHIYYLGRELYIRKHYHLATLILAQYTDDESFPDEYAEAHWYAALAHEAISEPSHMRMAEDLLFSALRATKTRRTFMMLAEFYHRNHCHQEAACFVAAALEIKEMNGTLNDPRHHGDWPYEILYLSRYHSGNKEEGKPALMQALFLNPTAEHHQNNTQFFL